VHRALHACIRSIDSINQQIVNVDELY
jgi:hypothetical protein